MLDEDEFNDQEKEEWFHIPHDTQARSYMKKKELWDLHLEAPKQIIFLVSLSSKWRP